MWLLEQISVNWAVFAMRFSNIQRGANSTIFWQHSSGCRCFESCLVSFCTGLAAAKALQYFFKFAPECIGRGVLLLMNSTF